MEKDVVEVVQRMQMVRGRMRIRGGILTGWLVFVSTAMLEVCADIPDVWWRRN
jgi:hypothetical protein